MSQAENEDNGRRSANDRRQYSYTQHLPERRQKDRRKNGVNRRSGADRRKNGKK